MFYFPLALIGMLSCFAIMIAVNALYAFVSVGRSIFNEKNLTGFKDCKWLISMACSVLIFCTLKKKRFGQQSFKHFYAYSRFSDAIVNSIV